MYEQIKSQEDIIQREKAIEVAEKFCDLIGGELGFLSNYYNRINLSTLLSSIKYIDLEYFDKDEFDTLFSTELKKKYMETLTIVDVKKAAETYILYSCGSESELASIRRYCDMNWELPEEMKEKMKQSDEIYQRGDKEEINQLHHIMDLWKGMRNAENRIQKYYDQSITSLLNRLEYLTMQFHTKLADEEIVYQSLHQLFLSIIKSLYGFIAYRNTKQPDKYYCNVIWLYKLWAQRYNEKTLEEVKNSRSLTHESRFERQI